MNADGTDQTNITDTAANDADPAWSPDGSRIAFVRRAARLRIYTVDPVTMTWSGSRTTQSMADRQVSDGSKLAFSVPVTAPTALCNGRRRLRRHETDRIRRLRLGLPGHPAAPA